MHHSDARINIYNWTHNGSKIQVYKNLRSYFVDTQSSQVFILQFRKIVDPVMIEKAKFILETEGVSPDRLLHEHPEFIEYGYEVCAEIEGGFDSDMCLKINNVVSVSFDKEYIVYAVWIKDNAVIIPTESWAIFVNENRTITIGP